MTASVYICAATASTMTSSISATSAGASRFACKLAEQRVHVSNWTRVVAVLEHEASLLRRLGEHDHIVRQVSPRLWQVSPRVFPFVTAHVGPSATARLTHPSPPQLQAPSPPIPAHVSLTRHLEHCCLSRPNIWTTFDSVRLERFFRGPSAVALVLELVPGGDCQQLLRRHGCLSEGAVQPMMRQLGDALSFLHAQGVVHRDVKLENLLCNTEVWPPIVKLCDFGHALTASEARGDTSFFGTPGYAAPEVAAGPLWSAAADVWAYGVVMFGLLANALPFDDGRHLASRGSLIYRRPDMSGRAWWEVSIDAKLLLASLLEPTIEERATLEAVSSSAWMVQHRVGGGGGGEGWGGVGAGWRAGQAVGRPVGRRAGRRVGRRVACLEGECLDGAGIVAVSRSLPPLRRPSLSPSDRTDRRRV